MKTKKFTFLQWVIVLIFLILLNCFVLATEPYAADLHCWYKLDAYNVIYTPTFSNTFSSVAKIDLGNESINGIYYNELILKNTRLDVTNISNFRGVCANGADLNFGKFLHFDLNNNPVASNVFTAVGVGRSIDTQAVLCGIDSSLQYFVSDNNLGVGIANNLYYNFNDELQDINYALKYVKFPIANTFDGFSANNDGTITGVRYNGDIMNARRAIISTPKPIFIFNESDETFNVYSLTGTVSKKIFFTLTTQSYFDLNIVDYNLHCDGQGVTCQIDKTKIGYTMGNIDGHNNQLIIPATITIDASKVPQNILYYLDVNYNAKNGINYSGQSYSKPSVLKTKLLDKQKFQVGARANYEDQGCVGPNGIIGVTGVNVYPRINLGVQPVDENTCEYLIDENYVYCSQTEFLINLGHKIEEIFNLYQTGKSATNFESKLDNLSNFNVSIRSQNLSKNEIFKILSTSSGLFSQTGLNRDLFGSNAQTQFTRLNNLFNKVEFIVVNSSGIQMDLDKISAGKYAVYVNFNNIGTHTNLFNVSSDSLADEKLQIQIILKELSKPEFDWFFYNTNQVIDPLEIEGISNTQNWYQTNIGEKRGVVLEIDENSSHYLINSHLVNQFATPIMIRISASDSNSLNTTFNLMPNNTTYFNNGNAHFTYWTGIGSNMVGSNGCLDISNELTILAHNEPDNLLNGHTADFVLDKYLSVKNTNAIEYLKSIIYLPLIYTTDINMTAPFKIYSKNFTNGTNSILFDSSAIKNEYYINDLQSVFDKIATEEICVYSEPQLNKKVWTLFWNEEKLYTQLDGIIAKITDAKICPN
ncbi:MAG: hypothetical protein PHQ98_01660 [Candidatus ainarchaeum sp.]|nr:hypothetical protein [Candidatus ainarchaeum sp.]